MILTIARLLRVAADSLEAHGAKLLVRHGPQGLPDAYDYIARFRYGHLAPTPLQVRSEMLRLLKVLSADPPRVVLELGTATGGTLFLFTRVATDEATIVTVDLKGGPFGGGYLRAHRPFLRSFARAQQTVRLVTGDSKNPETVDLVKAALGDRSVDFLFIDADHSYQGVSADYRTYTPLVRPGGVIALHDIVPGDPVNVGGVPKFWSEIKSSVSHKELVEDWAQGGFGIAVVRKPSKPDRV